MNICHSWKLHLCWEEPVGIGCWSRPYCTMRSVPCYDWSALPRSGCRSDLDALSLRPEHFNHNMERLSWYNTDEISTQCLRALPNKDGILKNDFFIVAVRCILGLPQVTFFNPLRIDNTPSDVIQRYTWYYGKERDANQWWLPPYARMHSKPYRRYA